jgi:hypothetical protein
MLWRKILVIRRKAAITRRKIAIVINGKIVIFE